MVVLPWSTWAMMAMFLICLMVMVHFLLNLFMLRGLATDLTQSASGYFANSQHLFNLNRAEQSARYQFSCFCAGSA